PCESEIASSDSDNNFIFASTTRAHDPELNIALVDGVSFNDISLKELTTLTDNNESDESDNTESDESDEFTMLSDNISLNNESNESNELLDNELDESNDLPLE
ncbi:2074_t:CDS:2, partial [Gigaspora rosea]